MPSILFSVTWILLIEESHFHGINHKEGKSPDCRKKSPCREEMDCLSVAAKEAPDLAEPWWSHFETGRIIIATPASQVQEE